MIIRKKTKEISNKFVQRKLVFRLRRLAIVLIILLGIICYDIFLKHANALFALSGIVGGYLLGTFLGSYANIHWHEESEKVIAKLDRVGIIVLILSICFSLSRRWILGHWVNGIQLSVISLGIAAGTMSGRIITIRKQIREILRGKGLLPPGKSKWKHQD